MDQLLSTDKTPLVFGNDSEISSFTEEPTRIDTGKKERQSILPLVAFLIFGVVYTVPIMQAYPTAHTCLALIVVIAFLWGTEAIPSYATAYLVPIIGVWFNIGIDPETHLRMPASEVASCFAYKFMDPIVLVFFGSMTMSAALSKLHITDRVSHFVFKHLSKNPKLILLTLMMLNCFVGAFLSLVASTTLILTFSMPIVRSLDPDDPFIKALLLGIAWSGNSGGMPTTIASTQNILALKYIQEAENKTISFIEWMSFGFPVAITITLLEWVYLIFRFKPKRERITVMEQSVDFEKWNLKHTYAVIITVATILLWTLQEKISNILGHVGITSLLPIVTFFGSGILTVEDFHTGIKWSILALMGGGLALGEAMKLSGLLDLISNGSDSLLDKIPMWPLLALFLVVVGSLGSLINSISVAAILYPVIISISSSTGHSSMFVALCALMVSGAQLFHISSFPNALISSVCKHLPGQPDQVTSFTFLSGPEFFTIGWITMPIGVLTVASVGYGITLAMKL